MAANPAAAQNDIGAALRQHDRVKRSTDLPLFYGETGRDSVTARHLIEKIDSAANIGIWDDARKYEEMFQIMRGNARTWFSGLKRTYGIRAGAYPQVKAKFLQMYDPTSVAKTTSLVLSEMYQRPHELVRDYYARILEGFEKMIDAKPEGIKTNTDEDEVEVGHEVGYLRCRTNALKDAENYILQQMFMSGLKTEIRIKVIEENKMTIGAAVDFAVETEVILADKSKKASSSVNAVNSEPAPGPAEPEHTINEIEVDYEMDDSELAAVNQVRAQKGQPLWRKRTSRPSGAVSSNYNRSNNYNNKNNGNKNENKCRYCKKFGHMQKECRSRIRAGAPMVDAQGKPYSVQKINEINQKDEQVSNVHLNW